jgi:hypothetical protein
MIEVKHMNAYARTLRGPVGAAAALAAAGCLVLAGCGSSGSSGGSPSGSTGGGSSTSPSATKTTGSTGSTSSASAASVPFPVGVGNTWTYKTTFGTTVNKTVSVTPVSGGQQVTVDSTNTIEGSTTHTSATYVVHSDGSITLPMSQFNTSTTQVSLVSGDLFWPPADEVASGQPYHDTLVVSYEENGTKTSVTAHVTVRGAGSGTVTVPAGTYTATIVDMTMTETIDGYTVSSEVKTWLAPGVGPVQDEVILNEAGVSHTADEEQLTSFTKG